MVRAVSHLHRRLRSTVTVTAVALGVCLGSSVIAAPAGAAGRGPADPAATAASNASNGSSTSNGPSASNASNGPGATPASDGPTTLDSSAAALASATLSQTSRYIVEFTPETSVVNEATIQVTRGMDVQSVLTNVFPGEIVDLTDSQVKSLRLNPRVRSIEADLPVAVETMQWPVTWGLDRINQRNLPLSGSYSYDRTGTGVKAYVVDTGILASHTDFGGRVTSGFSVWGASPTSAYGKCDRTPSAGPSTPASTTDEDGHGTHVSGTIGGTVHGVAKGVTLVPVRVLDSGGCGSTSGIISGLNWIIGNHAAGTPAVANLSLGMSASTSVDNAIRSTIADGVTVVVAAGNSNRDACLSSPSRVAEALTVAASDNADQRAYFSNYGTCVDLFAPGVSITSDYRDGKTVVMDGTSMASPHVAGAAALLLEATPTASPAEIAAALLAGSTTGVIGNPGTGTPNRLLNAGTIEAPVTEAPTAPTSVSATTPVNNATTVTWTLSSSGPTVDQRLNVYRDGSLLKTSVVSNTTTTVNYTGMTSGARYTFTVQARNTFGLSAESSASSPVVQATTPAAPTSLSASVTTGGLGSLTWTRGSDGGSTLTEQLVRTYRNNLLVATTSVSGSTTSFDTAASLDLGATYTFTVQARNALGLSPVSATSNSITNVTAPGAPTSVTAVVKSVSNVKVTWTLGTTGGSALTSQIVNVYANGSYLTSVTVSRTSKSLVLESVQLGVTYTFTVKAQNAIGWSSESASSNAVARTR